MHCVAMVSSHGVCSPVYVGRRFLQLHCFINRELMSEPNSGYKMLKLFKNFQCSVSVIFVEVAEVPFS